MSNFNFDHFQPSTEDKYEFAKMFPEIKVTALESLAVTEVCL